MRLARPTTRRLMAAVAVAALSLCGVRLVLLKSTYQRRAAWHELEEVKFRDRGAWAARMAKMGFVREAEVERSRTRSEHHAAIRRTYERAASRPWLPVPPDPPPPGSP